MQTIDENRHHALLPRHAPSLSAMRLLAASWMKLALALVVVIAAVYLVLVAVIEMICHAWNQPARDQKFLITRVLPVANFVKEFRHEQARFPSQREFRAWSQQTAYLKSASFFPIKPKNQWRWGVTGRDFMIGVWGGEWFVYYQSWDGRVFSADEPLIHDDKDR